MTFKLDEINGRCSWCLGSDLYKRYHDEEWGVPCHDSNKLFELICLEGAQAGLSWITILNKRQCYRALFADFNPVTVAQFTDETLDAIATNSSIVRHRKKIESVRTNAQAVLALRESGQEFSTVVWQHVNHRPVNNGYANLSDVPSQTTASSAMSKHLKKLGFSFVGPTTCYAFMQAAGLVNDHLVSCQRYSEICHLGAT